ncbi:nucleotide disphospho-sugar-binding domain-containing protein [Actinoplanes awajinensis]|uniref:nucleotide disphospho-sugar-binding domain-containing protein n=1 Tax=Actinoplanes awajinensis TaxID=135946 RepID=UPI0009FF42D1|nr:nucleotide disphospho-sugar-binding domain-containing protein [Actinoplanes awajinensis]
MRVLFVAAAGPHVPWIVPLSWACQLAGHQVRVAVRPQGVDAVKATGLVTVPVGDEATIQQAQNRHSGLAYKGTPRDITGNWFARPELLDKQLRVGMANRLLAAAEATAADTVALARAWRPDVVVYDTVASAGLVAAAAIGVPAIGHTAGYTLDFDYRGEPELWAAYQGLFDKFGLEPIFPEILVDPCPPSLRDPYRIPWAGMRLVSYNGPVVAQPWLVPSGDRPRICLTSGITTTVLDPLTARIARAVQKTGAELVIAVERADRAGVAQSLPDIRVVESYPLSVLLPTCDAVIHHGGLGTGMHTAANGVPQVTLPQSTSQDFWANKVEQFGLGVSIADPEAADELTIQHALETVLTRPEYRQRAMALQREVATTPAPAAVVGLLEDCAAGADIRSSPLVASA